MRSGSVGVGLVCDLAAEVVAAEAGVVGDVAGAETCASGADGAAGLKPADGVHRTLGPFRIDIDQRDVLPPGGGAASIIGVRHSEVAPTIGRRRRLMLELKPPDPLRRPG